MILLLKNLLLVIIFPSVVFILIPVFLLNHASFYTEGFHLLGFLLLLPGACILLWCVWDFYNTGRGTPAPIDPPKVLVVKGLYRYMRNPMYVGILSVIIGEAILFFSWKILLYAVCLGTFFQLMILFHEEPELQRLFGASYEEYKQRVHRWMPRFSSK